MPSYIVKSTPDKDEYVWWSDIVESPKAVGTRDEILEAMLHSGARSEEMTSDRFDRADKTGCSSMPGFYRFGTTGPIYEQQGFVPRHLIGEFSRRILAGDKTALELLEPLDG